LYVVIERRGAMKLFKISTYVLAVALCVTGGAVASDYSPPSDAQILNMLQSTGGAIGSSYYRVNCMSVIEQLDEESQSRLVDLEAKIAQQGVKALKKDPVAMELHNALQECKGFQARIADQIREKNYHSVKNPQEVLEQKIEMLTTQVENLLSVIRTDKKLAKELAQREKIVLKR
jgi:hypothetical protein